MIFSSSVRAMTIMHTPLLNKKMKLVYTILFQLPQQLENEKVFAITKMRYGFKKLKS